MKKTFLLLILCAAMGLWAQEYSATGIVIDANGNGVVGAEIRANKSKAKTTTTEGGVYKITLSPKDSELRLMINKYTVMRLPVSAEIAKNPIAFEMNQDNDPLMTGYMVGDTYYPGSNDTDINTILSQRFPGTRRASYQIDGAQNSMLTVTDASQIHSIRVTSNYSSSSRYKSDLVIIETKAAHQAKKNSTSAKSSSNRDDSIRGTVTDSWGRPVAGIKIKTPSGEEALTDHDGRYAVRISNKDRYLRCVMDYTQSSTVRISDQDKTRPINLTVMLRQSDLRGWWSEDMQTYYPGADEGNWENLFDRFIGVTFSEGKLYVSQNNFYSLSSGGNNPVNYIEVDGATVPGFDEINIRDVFSIRVIKNMAQAVAHGGSEAQNGAVIIVSRGLNTNVPVERTDWEAVKAKSIPGEEGMKAFIATQGKGLEYSDGKIIIDGKTCELYIINDTEYNNMRGIEAAWIDDIIIVRTGAEVTYGEAAKNGVVLISASQKEKMVVDEQGNTVTEKEAKKAKRKNKKQE